MYYKGGKNREIFATIQPNPTKRVSVKLNAVHAYPVHTVDRVERRTAMRRAFTRGVRGARASELPVCVRFVCVRFESSVRFRRQTAITRVHLLPAEHAPEFLSQVHDLRVGSKHAEPLRRRQSGWSPSTAFVAEQAGRAGKHLLNLPEQRGSLRSQTTVCLRVREKTALYAGTSACVNAYNDPSLRRVVIANSRDI